MNFNEEKILLKISGEALKNKNKSSIFDNSFLDNLCETIINFVKKYNCKLVIILGGGNIWRGVNSKIINNKQSDYIGMLATIMNGLYLYNILISKKAKVAILSQFEIKNCIDKYSIISGNRAIDANDILIVSGGTGKPCFTTDSAASIIANELNCKIILSGKNNTNGVYDKDPNIYKDAKFIERISYKLALEKDIKIIDKQAMEFCMNKNIKTIIFNINKPENLLNLKNGTKYSIFL